MFVRGGCQKHYNSEWSKIKFWHLTFQKQLFNFLSQKQAMRSLSTFQHKLIDNKSTILLVWLWPKKSKAVKFVKICIFWPFALYFLFKIPIYMLFYTNIIQTLCTPFLPLFGSKPIFFWKTVKNHHFDIICHVITPEDFIFGAWKCLYCVASNISNEIGYELHTI